MQYVYFSYAAVLPYNCSYMPNPARTNQGNPTIG